MAAFRGWQEAVLTQQRKRGITVQVTTAYYACLLGCWQDNYA